MKGCLLITTLFTLSHLINSQGYLSTCARMDVPILDKAARALCITSCSVQNCGTGSCKKVNGRKTCYCYRCARGGNVPLDNLVGKKGR